MTYQVSSPKAAARALCVGMLLLVIGSCSTGPTKLSREVLSKSSITTATGEKPPLAETSETKGQNSAVNPLGFEGQARFEWPVEDARFIRGFLPQKKRPHWGVDLAASRGTPIYSAQAGMVIYAGRDFRGYGKMVLVESGTGWATLYAHMDKILVDEGQTVTPKDVLGLMGRTGRATGVHLHFEIRRGKGPVDPLEYLPGGHRIAGRI